LVATVDVAPITPLTAVNTAAAAEANANVASPAACAVVVGSTGSVALNTVSPVDDKSISPVLLLISVTLSSKVIEVDEDEISLETPDDDENGEVVDPVEADDDGDDVALPFGSVPVLLLALLLPAFGSAPVLESVAVLDSNSVWHTEPVYLGGHEHI
jgi:hypothetical protein